MKFKATERLQSFLISNIRHEFIEQVVDKIYKTYKENPGSSCNISAEQCRSNVEFTIFLDDEYFIQIPEYNPDKWNNFPDVKPPEPGYYRIESNHVSYREVTKSVRKECWLWTGSYWEWVNAPGRVVNTSCHANIKFKPW